MLKNGMPFSAAYNDGILLRERLSHNPSEIKGNGAVPKTGTIILYNEIVKWQDRKMCRPHRGCGIVAAETEYLILIERAIFPGCFIKTSFPKSDFRLGLIKYVQLKDFVYKKDTTFHDLDIHNLTDNIRRLVVDV